MANYELIALNEATPQLRAPGAADNGVVSNLTVTTNLNAGTVGATNPGTGAFTALSASGTVTLTGTSTTLGDIGSIGQDTNSLYVGANFTSTGANFRKTGNYAMQAFFNSISGEFSYRNTVAAGTAGDPITWGVVPVRITAAGLVGINAIPSETLTVGGAISATTTIRPGGYTVATLPAGTAGMKCYVTDALAPAFLTTLVGGGAAYSGAQYNGSNWVGD